MIFTKAGRRRHCGDSVEAPALDEIGDHVSAVAKPSSPLLQVSLRADLVGNNCTAAGLTASGRAPVLALARLLIVTGHHPTTQLEVFRGDVLALRVRSIDEAADLTVEDDWNGRPRFRRWRMQRQGRGTAPPVHRTKGARPAATQLRARCPGARHDR